jgi:hypothetical protein
MVQKLILLATGLAVGIIAGWFLKTQAIENSKQAAIEAVCIDLVENSRNLMKVAEAHYVGGDIEINPNIEWAQKDERPLTRDVVLLDDRSRMRNPEQAMTLAKSFISGLAPMCGKAKQLKLQNEMDALIKRHPDIMKSRPTE